MTLRPKLLDRLVLSEIIPLFFVMAVVFTGIILVVASADIIGYMTQGVPFWIVIELIGFNILPWLEPTFPMAMLLAAIIGFVRLSTQSEVVALFAAGIPFRRLLAPLIVFSLLITALALYIGDTISPFATREFDNIKTNAFHELNQTTKPFDIPASRDSNGKLMLLAHCEGGYDITTHSLLNVYIFYINPKSGEIDAALHAPSAKWAGGSDWKLISPTVLAKGMYDEENFIVVKDLRQPPDSIALLQNGPDELSFKELFKEISELKASGEGSRSDVLDAEVSLWDRISLPFACFAFAIIGAPLGLRPQRNAALGIAITLGLAVIFSYYALYQYMHVLGASGHANPLFAAFLPDLLALAIGGLLLSRSSS